MKRMGESNTFLKISVSIAILIFLGILSSGCIGYKDGVIEDDYSDVTLTMRSKVKGTIGWQITIDSVSGSLELNDAHFRLVDPDNVIIWNKRIIDTNPTKFTKGDSGIWAIPPGSDPVQDSETGTTVTGTAMFENYEFCLMAYIDSDADEKVSSGDLIWVYRDYESDGFVDLRGTYTLEIKDSDNNLAGSVVISGDLPGATIRTRAKEKGTIGWQIIVDSVSGDLKLSDARFRFIDSDNIQLWQKTVSDANPAKFQKGDSYIYAIPSGSYPVRDNETGEPVTTASSFEKYELCYMAYIDSDADEKVSSGDALWVYKDYDSDGNLDYEGSYTFEFMLGKFVVGSEKL